MADLLVRDAESPNLLLKSIVSDIMLTDANRLLPWLCPRACYKPAVVEAGESAQMRKRRLSITVKPTPIAKRVRYALSLKNDRPSRQRCQRRPKRVIQRIKRPP